MNSGARCQREVTVCVGSTIVVYSKLSIPYVFFLREYTIPILQEEKNECWISCHSDKLSAPIVSVSC